MSCTENRKIKLCIDSFRSVIVLSGEAKLKLENTEIDIKKGGSIFMPAQNATARICGEYKAIISHI